MSRSRLGVPLREVMAVSDRAVPVGRLSNVNLAGVYSFGRGLFRRGPIDPQETSYKTYNRLVVGDFVISQPKAWEGALALVTPEFDGWYLSPVFPTFSIDRSRLLPEYLSWFCRRSSVWFDLQQRSRGIGARRETVSPEAFLSLEIPLPSVAEQRRIVERIEGIAARVEEAKWLRGEAEQEAQALLAQAFWSVSRHAPRQVMSQVAPLVRRPVEVKADGTYPELGIRSFGKGTFHKPAISGLEVGTKRLFRIEPGDLLFSNVFAWEGAMAVARPEDHGRCGSHRFITCVCKPDIAIAEYLRFYFLTTDGLAVIGEASPGGAGRNRTLGIEALGNIPVPIPRIEQQRWFTELSQQIRRQTDVRLTSTSELDAIILSVLDRAFRGEM